MHKESVIEHDRETDSYMNSQSQMNGRRGWSGTVKKRRDEQIQVEFVDDILL